MNESNQKKSFLENKVPIINDFLMKHQREGVQTAEKLDSIGLFYEVGTGKTYTSISILLQKTNLENRHLRILVLGPKSILVNWARELKDLQEKLEIPREKQYIPLVLNQNSSKNKMKHLKSHLNKKSVIITNYESLQSKELLEFFYSAKLEFLICDESQRVKNPMAQRTKKAMKLSETAKYNQVLTGTPILNNPMDIWSQLYILDKGKSLSKNFYVFRSQFFIDKNAGMPSHIHFPNWQLRSEMIPEFQNVLSKITVQAKRDDVLELPPLIKENIYVDLTERQMHHYQEMMNDFVTFIKSKITTETKAVVANLALTKMLRLQQIVSGFVIDENGILHQLVEINENPKLEALRDILEDTIMPEKKKVIIWSIFKEDHKQIVNLIKDILNSSSIKGKKLSEIYSYAELTGDIKDKQIEIDKFQKDPNCLFMIANQKAGGVGVNLQEASYSVYFSKNYSLEEDVQSEARCYRKGSEKHEKVVRIDLVAQNTVDELISTALKNKQEISDLILDYALKQNLQGLFTPAIQQSLGYTSLDSKKAVK